MTYCIEHSSYVERFCTMLMRLCHPGDFTSFLQYDEETKSFIGAAKFVGKSLDVLEQGLENLALNVTYEVQANKGVGSLDTSTGSYDGCLGLIQANRSDMILQMFEYPVAADNLTEGIVIYETVLAFGSTYRKVEDSSFAQMTSSFTNFSLTTWLLCILSVMSISCLLITRNKIGQQIRRLKQSLIRGQASNSESMRGEKNTPINKRPTSNINDYSILYTVLHMCRLHEIPARGTTRRLLFLSASIFALVVVQYFLIVIKTEIVVTKDPFTLESYQDLIDHNVHPIFFEGMGYDNYFKKKGIPKARQQLWEHTLKFDQMDVYTELNPMGFLLGAMLLIQRKAVVILEKHIMSVLAATGCPINARDPDKIVAALNHVSDESHISQLTELASLTSKQEANLRRKAKKTTQKWTHFKAYLFHVSVDPSEKPFSQEIILNPSISKELLKSMIFVIRRAFETGISNYMLESIDGLDILSENSIMDDFYGPPLNERQKYTTDCKSESLVKEQAAFHDVVIHNFRSLYFICFGLCLSSFVSLAFEFCIHWVKNDHRSRTKTDSPDHIRFFHRDRDIIARTHSS